MNTENQTPIIEAHSVEIKRHQAPKTPNQIWTYELLDQRQKQIAAQVEQEKPGALLLSEVAPVITLGRRMKAQDLKLPLSEYEKNGIQIYETQRGGFETYHGKGQWVLFPVDSLKALTGDAKGIKKIIDALLELAKVVCSQYCQSVEIRQDEELGVWSSSGKLASVGIQIQNGVVQHGLCINVYPTPQSFFGLNPCGLDAQADYLLDLKDQSISKETFFMNVLDSILDESLMYLWV